MLHPGEKPLLQILLFTAIYLSAMSAVQAFATEDNGEAVEEAAKEITETITEQNCTCPTENENTTETGDPESLSLQIIPDVQRGLKQIVTPYVFDGDGNIINGTDVAFTTVTETGKQLNKYNASSGEDLSFKVGPNTSPQNITISARVIGEDISGNATYSVFPKP